MVSGEKSAFITIPCKFREGRFGTFRECVVFVSTNDKTLAIKLSSERSTETHATLSLIGMKIKIHKGWIASATYSSKHLTSTFLKFGSEDDLHKFQHEMALQPVFRRSQDYFDIGEKIGEGHTCKVYLCQSKLTKEICAIKLSTKNKQSHREMHNELRILRYLNSEHPCLPKLKDYFYDSKGNIAIVLEYLNTSLGDYIGKGNLLPEVAAREIFHSILHCVDFLHQKGLAHRDLKVENLMFVPDIEQKKSVKFGRTRSRRLSFRSRRDSKTQSEDLKTMQMFSENKGIPDLKIIDFGFGKIQGNNKCWSSNTPCGTTRYMAPEIIAGSRYSQSVDMWSLGCILHFMLFGKLPFSKVQVQHGDVSEPRLANNVNISSSAKDLLLKLLSNSKEKRVSASESLQHSWFSCEELEPMEEDQGGDQPLSRVSLSPGHCLATVLNEMREEDDKLENDIDVCRHSPVSVFEKMDEAYKEKQIQILRTQLGHQLGQHG